MVEKKYTNIRRICKCLRSLIILVWDTSIKPPINFIAYLVNLLRNFQTLSINHMVYGFLWILAAITSVKKFRGLFEKIITTDKFGIHGQPIISEILYWFAVVTLLLHQFFIYQSLHQMEHGQIWKEKKWFGTRFEWLLRAMALVLLLYGVAKVPLIPNYFHTNKDFNTYQHLIIASSTILFFIMLIWDIGFGCTDKIWKYWKSNLLALFFWASITIVAYKINIPLSEYLPIFLVLITLIYLKVILTRLYKYLLEVPDNLQYLKKKINNAN